MKTVFILALVLTVMLWPLYRYANRPGQPADDWSSVFPWFLDFFLAAACWLVWLVWAVVKYLWS